MLFTRNQGSVSLENGNNVLMVFHGELLSFFLFLLHSRQWRGFISPLVIHPQLHSLSIS